MRSKIFLLLTILFLACSTLGQLVDGSEACVEKNQFLQRLQRLGVKIYEKPSFQSDRCREEWRVHGSCCEESSIENYVSKDSDKFDRLNSMLKSELESLQNYFTSLRSSDTDQAKTQRRLQQEEAEDRSEQEAQQDYSDTPATEGFSLRQTSETKRYTQHSRLSYSSASAKVPVDEPADAASRDTEAIQPPATPTTSELDQKLDAIIAQINSSVSKFSANDRRCSAKIREMRSSSMCSICSGRSEEFIVDNRALVDMQSCSDFVEDCFEDWVVLVDVRDILVDGKQLMPLLAQRDPGHDYQYRDDYIERLQGWLNNTSIHRHLRDCDNSASACRNQTKAAICDALLNIAEPSFVEDALELLLKARKTVTKAELMDFQHLETRFRLNNSPPSPIRVSSPIEMRPPSHSNRPATSSFNPGDWSSSPNNFRYPPTNLSPQQPSGHVGLQQTLPNTGPAPLLPATQQAVVYNERAPSVAFESRLNNPKRKSRRSKNKSGSRCKRRNKSRRGRKGRASRKTKKRNQRKKKTSRRGVRSRRSNKRSDSRRSNGKRNTPCRRAQRSRRSRNAYRSRNACRSRNASRRGGQKSTPCRNSPRRAGKRSYRGREASPARSSSRPVQQSRRGKNTVPARPPGGASRKPTRPQAAPRPAAAGRKRGKKRLLLDMGFDFERRGESLVPPASLVPPFASGHTFSDTSTSPTFFRWPNRRPVVVNIRF